MEGIITSVQRMSVHDGPGIRSTIFTKGCNLRCKWCHNPETFSINPELEWIKSKCIECHACMNVCKTKALTIKTGNISFNKKYCNACFDCVPKCFPEALNKIGRRITPEGLFEEIKQDFPFFKESGGGITISGGEPMLQKAFVKKTLKLFNEEGIHTALDTNLSVSWKSYEQVLRYTSLVLADIKTMNDELHKSWIGANNENIIHNIKLLDKSGVPFHVRTPLVPGFNDSKKELREIAGFVSTLNNLQRFDLLPYHPLADNKYENLGIDNPMGETPIFTDNERVTSILNKFNINFYFN